MKTYITYFRYDRGENYSIYNLETSLKRSIKSWKEKDLPSFLSYGPDDVSQLYLVKVDLPKTDVEIIKEKSCDRDFYRIMDNIHKNSKEVCSTSGDEIWDVVEFFCKYFRRYIDPDKYMTSIPTDKDELREVLQEVLFDNDDVFDMVLKYYINEYYNNL